MWKLPLFEVRASGTGNIDTELVGVFQEKGQGKQKKPSVPKGTYGPLVEKLRKGETFSAGAGATEFLRFGGKGAIENVLLVGMGTPAELTAEKLRVAGGQVWARLNAQKSRIISVDTESFLEAKELKIESGHAARAKWVRALAEGMILAAYQFKKYKTKSPDKNEYTGPSRVIFTAADSHFRAALEKEIAQVQAIGESVRVTRDWSNEPSNYGTPVYYANEARKLARENGLKCRILTEQDAAREKMGLFLGVGQGAERESRIVVLEYTPKGVKNSQKDIKTIAFVGKGVTFDSGGISIKPSLRMEEMKHDMTGAATVMGSVLLASKWKVPNRIIGIMAFTENMPSGNAIQPGNVLTARNGKTVEVINTDAEGRLVLGDALDFAQDFKPDAVVDIATLTGAVSVALGKHCCAVLGNSQELIESIRQVGDSCGERIWQLPLFDEYFEDLKSDYADMKNSANDGNGGTIRGAIFLKQFIRPGTSWIHLDIASTAYNVSHLSYFPKKGASGAHVRTLAQFAAEF